MRIQLLNGALGNQAFQYIFVRFAERYCPDSEPWYFDDTAFYFDRIAHGAYLSYELENIFGIKVNLLSDYFDSDVWAEIVRLRKEGVSLPQTFLNMGIPLTMLAETSDFSFNGKVLWTPTNEFHPEILKLPHKDLYYHGYWINKHWFSTYRDENLAEFIFPKIDDAKNLHYADMITSCMSVGVHIRRGDFVNLGWALPLEYYLNASKAVIESRPDAQFFVVSDDIDWCKENAEALGLNLVPQTTYIIGNPNPKHYIDMQLLSMCRGLIMSNSSFCYLAALLNRNLQIWVNPTKREI